MRHVEQERTQVSQLVGPRSQTMFIAASFPCSYPSIRSFTLIVIFIAGPRSDLLRGAVRLCRIEALPIWCKSLRKLYLIYDRNNARTRTRIEIEIALDQELSEVRGSSTHVPICVLIHGC